MIRYARPEDAKGMGAVYCRAWRAGYRGILPDGLLDGLTDENSAPDPEKITGKNSLIAEKDGSIVGLAAFGAARSEAEDGLGELWTIYVLPGCWRGGVGTELFRAAAEALREMGYVGFFLWTLEENRRARAFYERMDMRENGKRRSISIGGAEIEEVQYEIWFSGAENE